MIKQFSDGLERKLVWHHQKEILISKALSGGKLPLDYLLSEAEKAVPKGIIMQVRMPEKVKKGKARRCCGSNSG